MTGTPGMAALIEVRVHHLSDTEAIVTVPGLAGPHIVDAGHLINPDAHPPMSERVVRATALHDAAVAAAAAGDRVTAAWLRSRARTEGTP